MPTDEPMENARAGAEAREAVARRSDRGAGSTEDALKRYLASETFRERRREQRDATDAGPDDGQDE